MHLLACFPGRKMFVLRTCPFVFSSFPFFGSDAFGWACVRIGDEQRDSSRFWDVSLAIDLCFPIAIDETTPPHTHIEKNTRFLCCCIFFYPMLILFLVLYQIEIPLKITPNQTFRSLCKWKQSWRKNTFHGFTLWISKPIKLYHVGLQSGCLQDQVADIQSNAFTQFPLAGQSKG